MKCDKCKKDFEERELDCSHDIPKYLGGTDLDGRHHLCKGCHNKYEKLILVACLKYIGEELVDGEEIMWMKELSRQSEELKQIFRGFAHEIKMEFYKEEYGTNKNT